MMADPLEAARRRWERASAGSSTGVDAALWEIAEAWDEAAIPQRPWVAKGYLMRGCVSVLSGPGSAGKSSLTNLWCVSLGSGRNVGGFYPAGRCRVMTYNVEDDRWEQQRRFSAVFRSRGVRAADVMDHLRILGPEDVGTLLTFDRDDQALVDTEVMKRLEEAVEAFRPDVLFLDPFVELHGADENDNTAVRIVMAKLRTLAKRFNMAVCVLHHTRKGVFAPGDPDSLRGASAIVGAARVVLTMAVMTTDEAKSFEVPEHKHRAFFRVDGAKSNYAPIEDAEWFERFEVDLANGEAVAACRPWKAPALFAKHTPDQINLCLDRIAAGPTPGTLYGPTQKGGSTRWVGNAVIEMLGANQDAAGRIVSKWLETGLLFTRIYTDEKQRKDLNGVYVRNDQRPA